jgi:hypothetical protein
VRLVRRCWPRTLFKQGHLLAIAELHLEQKQQLHAYGIGS